MTTPNRIAKRVRTHRLPRVATLALVVIAGCDTRGEWLQQTAAQLVAKAGDDKVKAIEMVAKQVFIAGFYDRTVEVSGDGDEFVVAVTFKRTEEKYLPPNMKAFRANHLRDRGVEALQMASLAGPLGLTSMRVTVQVTIPSAGGVVDMLELRCGVDDVLAAVPDSADPFGSTRGRSAGEWTEETRALGPIASAACEVVQDRTGEFEIYEEKAP